jgi:hypothetical protein
MRANTPPTQFAIRPTPRDLDYTSHYTLVTMTQAFLGQMECLGAILTV